MSKSKIMIKIKSKIMINSKIMIKSKIIAPSPVGAQDGFYSINNPIVAPKRCAVTEYDFHI